MSLEVGLLAVYISSNDSSFIYVCCTQVSFAVEELERNLGLDPGDPIVSFVLFVGTASALWYEVHGLIFHCIQLLKCHQFHPKFIISSDLCRAFYWVSTYSGYSGDLSPKLTSQLLMGKENAVLIDIRPEARYSKLVLAFSCIEMLKWIMFPPKG